ncbi:MAG: haloacid dehalogenase type II [Acidobacteriota bacterium]
MRMTVQACVFDAYGTLLDLNGAVAAVAGRLGDRAADLLRVWRGKQLEYTWLRSLMGRHADFAQVTREALDYACAAVGGEAAGLQTALLDAFFHLPAYPDAEPLLRAIRARGLRTAVLSNGTPGMLDAGLRSTALGPLLDAILSVEDVGVYKPSPAVYQHASATLGLAPDALMFVSANAWDAAGASSAGLRAIWINRSGAPSERLPSRPAAEVASLADVADLLATDSPPPADYDEST